MPPPVEVLKEGLARLSEGVEARKKDLEAKLACKEHISEADEQWHNSEGNMVEAQRVVDRLESAEDYEKAWEELGDSDRAVISSLQELAAREASGMDGSDEAEDNDVVKPIPTRREIFKAISTITEYLGLRGDPIARELEASLYTFRRHLRSLEEVNLPRDTTPTSDSFKP